MNKTKITWNTNRSTFPVVDMSKEEEFRTEILEKLSHKMLAMAYSPENDANGVMLSQFSQVEEAETLWKGEFRLFSSYAGTKRKTSKLASCIVLKDGEKLKSERLRGLPVLLSADEDGEKRDVFTMFKVGAPENCGCLTFYLPYHTTRLRPNEFRIDTAFSRVLECLSYDLYPSYLEKRGLEDSALSRKKFFTLLDNADAMEFVEEQTKIKEVLLNYSKQRPNLGLNDYFKGFQVVFRRLSLAEHENGVYESLFEANKACEDNVSRLERRQEERIARKAREEEAQRLIMERNERLAQEQESDPADMIVLTIHKGSKNK